jgi:two-component system chemotaxis response regulator CheY
MKAEKQEKLFKEFLESSDILITDKSSASRRRLTKTLVDMGAKRNQIHSIAHYSEAVDIIETKKPKLILSDYALNGGSGFDLFKDYREKYPDEKKSVLILVTSNISQSAVAKAAEEDVDSFIIKPYTVQSLEKSLISTVISKLYPSEYVKTVEKGKEALFEGKYEVALEIFDAATKLNKKPSLALFYHGQTKYMLEAAVEAENDYKKGLEINNIHFKCQVGLYELFKKDGKNKEAYDVVKNISKYFPANPERLKEVIRLCMTTESYADMEIYYELFMQLEERPDDVVNYICSGLFISGKYYMMEGQVGKGREIFEKVGISCAGTTKFLNAMVILLVENKIYPDAQKLLARFSGHPDDEASYLISSYLANSDDMEIVEKISKGLELYNKGNKHPLAVEILIDALESDGNEKRAAEYREEAEHIWPERFKPSQKDAA